MVGRHNSTLFGDDEVNPPLAMEYENQRLMRIKENKIKMKELGIKTLAYEAMSSVDAKRQKICNKKSSEVLGNDDDFIPDKEGEINKSREENDIGFQKNIRNLRSHSKKVMATREGSYVKSVDKSQHSTNSLSSMIRTNLARMSEELQSNDKMQQGVSLSISERDKPKESKSQTTTKKKKNLVAPGSLGAYVKMKEQLREKERLSKHAQTEPIQKTKDLSFSLQMEQQTSSSMLHNMLGLVDEDDEYKSSDNYDLEEENDDGSKEIEDDTVAMTDIPTPIEDNINELVFQKRKRTRGPSLCKEVHGWPMNSRKLIILNEHGQPIGPDKTTLDQFSHFLGSLARSSDLAPLNKHNWHQVSNKDDIWDYVKKKFIIADEGKDYVLQSVGALWRNYKCRIKKTHYKDYKTMIDRWKNRPSSIPKSHFADLLKYWDQKDIKAISVKKKEIRDRQVKDRHTAGPLSFARIRHELEQVEKKQPSKATMYRETRKRHPDRKYKTSCDLSEDKIMEKVDSCTLSGRVAKRVKKPLESGTIIPEDFLQPYKVQIMKDTVDELMHMLQQVLPADVITRITPSFKDPLNQCQNNKDGDEANHDVDHEKGDEGIENEFQDLED